MNALQALTKKEDVKCSRNMPDAAANGVLKFHASVN
jgi:hypothetical protein